MFSSGSAGEAGETKRREEDGRGRLWSTSPQAGRLLCQPRVSTWPSSQLRLHVAPGEHGTWTRAPECGHGTWGPADPSRDTLVAHRAKRPRQQRDAHRCPETRPRLRSTHGWKGQRHDVRATSMWSGTGSRGAESPTPRTRPPIVRACGQTLGRRPAWAGPVPDTRPNFLRHSFQQEGRVQAPPCALQRYVRKQP